MQMTVSGLDVSEFLESDQGATITVSCRTSTGSSVQLADYKLKSGNSLIVYCHGEPDVSFLRRMSILNGIGRKYEEQ